MPSRSAARQLAIWANGVRVGTWSLLRGNSTELAYDEDWLAAPEARPLSLSLPLTIDLVPHRSPAVENYFDNLLPDSDPIRRRLQGRFSAASSSAFDLLRAIGRDCIGAVQILPEDESPADIRKIEAHTLSDDEIAGELTAVTTTSRLVDHDHFRISIAGAQEKTAFLKHNGRWCRPIGSTPTTHIFKLPLGLVGGRQADFSTSVENEWLCARIVHAFGIPVAPCEMSEFSGHKVLIVERFDRQLHSGGRHWLRLMQEDFAQATATPWNRKYQSDGGPGVEDLARILRGSAHSTADLTTLFRSQLLFYLLAAIDGHAKNFSLRILAGGSFHLTPLYDVLSAWPVIGKKANEIPLGKVKLAMSVPGGRPHYLYQTIQRRHFETMGKKLGLGPDTARLIDEMLVATPKVIDEVQRGLPRGFPQILLERVLDGLRRSASTLG